MLNHILRWLRTIRRRINGRGRLAYMIVSRGSDGTPTMFLECIVYDHIIESYRWTRDPSRATTFTPHERRLVIYYTKDLPDDAHWMGIVEFPLHGRPEDSNAN